MRTVFLFSLLATVLISSSPANDPPTVAFVGDSLTLGANSTDYVGFVGRTEAGLGIQAHRFVWYHLADALMRWDQVSATQPDAIIIELGVHAVVGCDHLVKNDGAQFQKWYSRVVEAALSDTPNVCIINIPWLNWCRESAARALWYNSKLALIADVYNIRVIDAWSATANCGACISADGFHLNDLGHQRIADEILRACPGAQALARGE